MELNIERCRYKLEKDDGYAFFYVLDLKTINHYNPIIPCRPDYSAKYFDMSEKQYIDLIKNEFHGMIVKELNLADKTLYDEYILFIWKNDCEKFKEWIEPQLTMAKLAKGIVI